MKPVQIIAALMKLKKMTENYHQGLEMLGYCNSTFQGSCDFNKTQKFSKFRKFSSEKNQKSHSEFDELSFSWGTVSADTQLVHLQLYLRVVHGLLDSTSYIMSHQPTRDAYLTVVLNQLQFRTSIFLYFTILCM